MDRMGSLPRTGGAAAGMTEQSRKPWQEEVVPSSARSGRDVLFDSGFGHPGCEVQEPGSGGAVGTE